MNITRFRVFLAIAFLILFAFIFRTCVHKGTPAKKNPYKIGFDTTWYPLQAAGKDKEKSLTAFFSELMVTIAREGNFRFEFVQADPTNLFSDLDKGNFDAIVTAYMPTDWSNEKYRTSSPLLLFGPVLVLRKDSVVLKLTGLSKQPVGYKKNAAWLFKLKDCCALVLIPYKSNYALLEDLKEKKLNGAILPYLEAQSFLKAFYSDSLKILYPPISEEALRVVMKNDAKSLLFYEQFEQGWKKVKENGTYTILLEKWGLPVPPEGTRL